MDISTLNKRQLISIAVIIVLLVALPLIIYLVRQTQIFKPKAVGESSSMEVLDSSGNNVGQSNNTYQPPTNSVMFRLHYRE